jgi:hypothetical protein
MLRPGGWLAVMTERLPQPGAFAGWYYLKDPTHVCFYAEDTFHWIARRHGFATPLFPGPRVALLQRPR